MAKPLSALPPSGAAPLHVSLILGSFVHKPASFDLFDLHIPPSAPAPVHAEEVLYHPRPEIMHTFRADQKLPPRPVSALFTAISLAPWAALFVLVRVVSFLRFMRFGFCALLTTGLWVVLIVGCGTPRHPAPLLTKHPLFRTLPYPHRGPPILVLDRASSWTNPLVWLRCGHACPTHG
jgi:hypothetical protein